MLLIFRRAALAAAYLTMPTANVAFATLFRFFFSWPDVVTYCHGTLRHCRCRDATSCARRMFSILRAAIVFYATPAIVARLSPVFIAGFRCQLQMAAAIYRQQCSAARQRAITRRHAADVERRGAVTRWPYADAVERAGRGGVCYGAAATALMLLRQR